MQEFLMALALAIPVVVGAIGFAYGWGERAARKHLEEYDQETTER